MGSATLPAGYDPCPECGGTGREVEIDEVWDEDMEVVVAEISRDYGPCEPCEGRGWFRAETPDERIAREQQEGEERFARAIRRHLDTAKVHGYAHCPWGCPIEDEMRSEHMRPGGVHDTQCVDRCIGY